MGGGEGLGIWGRRREDGEGLREVGTRALGEEGKTARNWKGNVGLVGGAGFDLQLVLEALGAGDGARKRRAPPFENDGGSCWQGCLCLGSWAG